MADNRAKWEEHISSLKGEREKREQGLDYKIPDTFTHKEEAAAPKTKISEAVQEEERNPFVRRLSLDELVDMSRAMQNKPPLERVKPTPFISKEKEIDTPTLGK